MMDWKNAPADGAVRLAWTGGAGFMITFQSLRIGIDLYLSDACRDENGAFKRLTLPPCRAEDLELDYLISTHDHGDHFDVGSVPIWLERLPDLKIIGPSSVIAFAEGLGLDTGRFIRLDRGMGLDCGPVRLRAVTADHGDQSPDAIGVILELGGKSVFFAGDGTYHDRYTDYTMGYRDFDVLLVAINGQFGNPDAQQAADIAAMLTPRAVIPCHYWMFKEHGGDPMQFVTACLQKEPPLCPVVLAVGEEYRIL